MHLRLVVSDEPERGRLPCGSRDHPLLSELSPDNAETLCLRVLRYACIAMRHGSLRPLDAGHQAAERELGLVGGASLIACCMALLRGMRSERRAKFVFMAPECPACSQRISSDERLILLMLRAGRTQDFPLLHIRAREIAQVGPAPAIAQAGMALGKLLRSLPRPAQETATSAPDGDESRP